MAEPATLDAVENVRQELQAEIDGLRREISELRGLVEGTPSQSGTPKGGGGATDWLDRARDLREAILRRRGGEMLPPSAAEIAAARDERGAALLGESGE